MLKALLDDDERLAANPSRRGGGVLAKRRVCDLVVIRRQPAYAAMMTFTRCVSAARPKVS